MAFTSKLMKIDIDDYQIAYHREGSGEPIVLVHGITSYSFLWRNVVPHLRDKHEVIAYDLLGNGESDKPLNISYSIKKHAHILEKLTDKWGISKFHLVGHDVGGGISQIFAVNNPEMLHTLTLINSVAYDFWPVQPIIAMRTPIIRQLAMASLDIGAFKALIRHGVYKKENVNADIVEYFNKPMRTSNGRKAFLHFAKSLNNQDLLDIEKELQSLPIRTLIIRGMADPFLSSEISSQLHKNIPHSEYVKINNSGHYIQEDEPELLAKTILDFINSQ